jgi:hypothetical protein
MRMKSDDEGETSEQTLESSLVLHVTQSRPSRSLESFVTFHVRTRRIHPHSTLHSPGGQRATGTGESA